MRIPDVQRLGVVTIESERFAVLMVRDSMPVPDAPEEMDTVQGRDAWEAGFAAAYAVETPEQGRGDE